MGINAIETNHQHVETSLPSLKIGKYTLKKAVIQGGMGLCVSTSSLAGAVAEQGGRGNLASGVIHESLDYKEFRDDTRKKAIEELPAIKSAKVSGGEIWSDEDDEAYFSRIFKDANLKCIPQEIWKAKKIAGWEPDENGRDTKIGNGPIGINIMCAGKEYEPHVRASCKAGVHIIVSGAGLPLQLPEYTKDFPDVALVPIVSSLKAATTIINFWETKHKRYPDAIVVESVKTGGGHLGAVKGKLSEVNNPDTTLEVAVPAIVEYIKQRRLADPNFPDIPVISAGGIVTRQDIDKQFALGARGVQMGTRFLASKESNAHQNFKEHAVNATPDDVGVYNSSACYPARFLKKSLEGEDIEGVTCNPKIKGEDEKNKKCLFQCLTHCAERDRIPGYAQICITKKLLASIVGSKGNGLEFIGYPFDEQGKNKLGSILTVKEIFDTLEYNAYDRAAG